MVSDGIDYTKEQYALFGESREKPHVLDESLIDRGINIFKEQIEHTNYYDLQIDNWRNQNLSESYKSRVNQLEVKVSEFRKHTKSILELLEELRKGTINRIMEMDDMELALKVLKGDIKPPIDDGV